ncbi:polyribonucleotide nucleotidyltransferase [Klebsiella phage vB_KpnS-VAC2]|uniref:Polyribonucleotide nucleotidyltransferase n=1 Tax=Klebsiella phage vB_KpnS-VAC2 TaxID=2864369 RepID=A0AAE8BYV9_9CAUD|nr:polyribonucleotide nucleotidyltransferase [Klebsiella phage vB_KpnS-VAC2]
MNHPKTDAILAVLHANGRVILRMNRASGFTQITITKSSGRYIVGTVPGGRLVPSSLAGVTLTLESNSMFIEGWKS